MTNSWSMYDELINGIPDGPVVIEATINWWWAAVRTDTGSLGVAMPFTDGLQTPASPDTVAGKTLREVAPFVKSWHFGLAGLGLAAINAWYATAPLSEVHGTMRRHSTTFFARNWERMVARRTVVVGHFVEVTQLGDAVTVLDREPKGSDLPDTAAEYVIPGAELVIVSGSSLVNKTFPRLMELAKNAEVHVVGPSSPLAPAVYPPWVRSIATVAVTDQRRAWNTIAMGGHLLADPASFEMIDLELPVLEAAR